MFKKRASRPFYMMEATLFILSVALIIAVMTAGLTLYWSVRREFPLVLAGMAALTAALLLRHWYESVGLMMGRILVVILLLVFVWVRFITRSTSNRGKDEILLTSAAAMMLLLWFAKAIPITRIDHSPAWPLIDWNLFHALCFPLCLGALGLIWILTHHSKLGLAMRAIAHNPDTAALMGINADRIALQTAFIATALVCLGSALYAIRAPPVDLPGLIHPALLALTAAVLAGPRRLWIGCAIGAIIGAIDAVLIYHAWPHGSLWPDVLPVALILIVGLFRLRTPAPLDAQLA